MPMSPDPASNEPSAAEAQLLADCYAILLANIRQNRARRLAQSAPKPVASEPASQGAELQLDDTGFPQAVDRAHRQASTVANLDGEG